MREGLVPRVNLRGTRQNLQNLRFYLKQRDCNVHVNYGDEQTYLFNLRMTRVQLEHASDKITEAGFLKDSMHSAHSLRLSGRFKFAT